MHFLDVPSAGHVTTAFPFAMPGMTDLQALKTSVGMTSSQDQQNALNPVPGAAKSLPINTTALNLDDTGTAAGAATSGTMAIAVVAALLVGCIFLKKRGSDDDDDDDSDLDEDSKDYSN